MEMPKGKTAKKKKERDNHEQEAEQYVVAIDGDFFLNWKGDDWTEKLLYARRFSKPNEAAGWVRDVEAKHPERHVRVCRVWIGFVVSEIN